jgi:hypothetical protein
LASAEVTTDKICCCFGRQQTQHFHFVALDFGVLLRRDCDHAQRRHFLVAIKRWTHASGDRSPVAPAKLGATVSDLNLREDATAGFHRPHAASRQHGSVPRHRNNRAMPMVGFLSGLSYAKSIGGRWALF